MKRPMLLTDEVTPISTGHAPQVVDTGALVEALVSAATAALD